MMIRRCTGPVRPPAHVQLRARLDSRESAVAACGNAEVVFYPWKGAGIPFAKPQYCYKTARRSRHLKGEGHRSTEVVVPYGSSSTCTDLPVSFHYLGNQGDVCVLFRCARASVSVKETFEVRFETVTWTTSNVKVLPTTERRGVKDRSITLPRVILITTIIIIIVIIMLAIRQRVRVCCSKKDLRNRK